MFGSTAELDAGVELTAAMPPRPRMLTLLPLLLRGFECENLWSDVWLVGLVWLLMLPERRCLPPPTARMLGIDFWDTWRERRPLVGDVLLEIAMRLWSGLVGDCGTRGSVPRVSRLSCVADPRSWSI